MSDIIYDDSRGTMRVGLVNETRSFSWRPKPAKKRYKCQGKGCETVLTRKDMRYCERCEDSTTGGGHA